MVLVSSQQNTIFRMHSKISYIYNKIMLIAFEIISMLDLRTYKIKKIYIYIYIYIYLFNILDACLLKPAIN